LVVSDKGPVVATPPCTCARGLPLEAGPHYYKTFRDKEDGCIKVVMKP
jgi:threonine dehydrogenase-like Zn-dependent dehydrogenase